MGKREKVDSLLSTLIVLLACALLAIFLSNCGAHTPYPCCLRWAGVSQST